MAFVSFQAQLVSIMDIVAKAAVAEIKRRVEESCAGMRLELSRSRKDIDALKRKCVMMDSELRRVRGRGRRRVWMCGSSDRASTPLKTIRDQDQNPDHTHHIQQSVCSLEDDISAPAIKQERQEQETGGIESLTEAQENHKPVFGASEIQNAAFTHVQTSTGHPEPQKHDEERLDVKAEDQEGSGVELRFGWSSFPEPPAENTPVEPTVPASLSLQNPSSFSSEASRISQRPAETQIELYEAERIRPSDQMSGVYAQQHQNAPAVSRGPSASVRRLRTHWRSSADAEKRFSCSFCEKSFSRFSQLKEHLRSHTGEKPFSCAQCGRSFTKHCNLIRHAVVHSGEKPYQCGQCGKRFTQRSSLKSHQRMHADAWDHR